tara:strand:- start:576 stop:785 length:210 start_codon:yes stop_codon:yes gene_type:complete
MNKDHIESVHKFLKHYLKIYDFDKARMMEIQSEHMKIMYDDKIATIKFEKEISEEEIHDTLVRMSKATS